MESNEFYIPGENNIMLVAPHGHMKPKLNDDEYTAEIAKSVAKKLKCHAVINTVYRKPREIEDKKTKKEVWEEPNLQKGRINLNRLTQYQNTSLYDEFVQPIIDTAKKCLKSEERFYIFHIHGGSTEQFLAACEEVHPNDSKKVDILIGIGRGRSSKKGNGTITAPPGDLKAFIAALKKEELLAYSTTHPEYAAKAAHNLNQLFRGENREENVISFQLEICKAGRRDNEENAEVTADKLASAISAFTGVTLKAEAELILPEDGKTQVDTGKNLPTVVEEEADKALVSEAIERLVGIYAKHGRNILWEAGCYIIETFYGGIEQARSKKPVKKLSYDLLEEEFSNSPAGSPGKTWLYNAVNLVVLEYDFKRIEEEDGNDDFQALGNLTNSHKLLLLTAPAEKRMALALEAGRGNYSTRKLAERIKDSRKPRNTTLLSYIRKPAELFTEEFSHYYSEEALSGLRPKQIQKIKDRIAEKTKELEGHLKNYKDLSQKLAKAEKGSKGNNMEASKN